MSIENTNVTPRLVGEISTDVVYIGERTSEILTPWMEGVDDDIATLQSDMLGKASTSHVHSGYATANHTHTGYAAASHAHSEYAETSHTHDGYADADHTHDGYASADHTHTGFAAESHTHDGYAAASHSHYAADVGAAAANHTHDYAASTHTHSEYAAASHSHSGYASSGHTHSEYAAASHSHDYASSGHTHTAADIGALSTSGGTVNGNLTVTPYLYTAQIAPKDGGSYSIGSSDNRYYSTYLRVNPNVSSDRRCKRDIETIGIDELAAFIGKLGVVSYNYKDDAVDEGKRIGLIAQDVLAADEDLGRRFVEEDEKGFYSLRPADLVFPLIAAVQKLQKELDELKK